MKTRTLALAALAAALCGCPQADHASLEFYGICAGPKPDTSTTAGGCTYSSTCALYALFHYWYDPAVLAQMVVPIEMFNQLPNNADLSSGRVNTNDAVIQQWRLEYDMGGGVTLPVAVQDNFTVPAASHKTALVPVFPTSVNALMRTLPAGTEITVSVRAAGHYLDERTFETGPFKLPAGVRTYVAPVTCVAPKVVVACPAVGQEGTYDCGG